MMLSQLVGFLNLIVGVIFAFGTYLAFVDKHINTIAFVILPFAHLLAGIGLLRYKSWSRYFVCSLAIFYGVLGILSLKDALPLMDYIPIVPLVRYIPISVLGWFAPWLGVSIFLILIPMFCVLLLSSKMVAARFESWLGGRFSWSAPFPVILASGFIFSYALLIQSRLSFFLLSEGRNLFGFQLSPLQNQMLHYVEFYFPLVLAFGLTGGGKLVFYGTLVLALYHWIPFFTSDTKPVLLRDFDFVFFGAGWALTALLLLIYRSFFLGRGIWLEKRGISQPKGEAAPIGETLKPVEEKAKPRFALDRRWVYLILAIAFVSFVSGSVVYLWLSGKLNFSKGKRKQSISLGMPHFRFEGSSIDRHGTFAVIQGNVVQVGQTVQGYRVEAIESDRVLLSKEGKHYSLDAQGNLKPIS